jgi:type IV secretory pathway VirB4 component
MTVDELFALREQMQEVLSSKLNAKKAALERRLQPLNQLSNDIEATKPRQSWSAKSDAQLTIGGRSDDSPVQCALTVKLRGFCSLYQPSKPLNFGHSIKEINWDQRKTMLWTFKRLLHLNIPYAKKLRTA